MASRIYSILLVLISGYVVLIHAQVDNLLIEAPASVSAPQGFNATFTCRGLGEIVWVINGDQVRNEERIMTRRNEGIFVTIDDQINSTIAITASTLLDGLSVVCRIETEFSVVDGRFQDSEQAFLSVFGLPNGPMNFQISIRGIDFILDWESPSEIRENEIISYQIRILGSGQERILETNKNNITFSESLGPRDCSNYEFLLRTVNQVGLSESGSVRNIQVPTAPRQLISDDVSTIVTLNGPEAQLQFDAPAPCPTYRITRYTVEYNAFEDSNDLSVAAEQRRSITFTMTTGDRQDTITLGNSDGLVADRLVLVDITAINDVGSTLSQQITFRTTNTQSASVNINSDYSGTVSCTFASGSTVEGCQISFSERNAMGDETFLFNLTLPRSDSSSESSIEMQFEEVPTGSEIVAVARDVQLIGSIGLIAVPAMVLGPFTPTTEPPTTRSTTVQTNSRFTTLESSPGMPLSSETLYIIIGAGAGGLALLLLLIIIISCVICCCVSSRRRKLELKTEELASNHAYGESNGQGNGILLISNGQSSGAQLTGVNGIDYRPRNNTYQEKVDMPAAPPPAYETIDEAKKGYNTALEKQAPNPVYSYATTSHSNSGSQANLVQSSSQATFSSQTNLIQGSDTNLVNNPVYAETSASAQQPPKGKSYSDVSALNPIYSGTGTGQTTPIPTPVPRPSHNPQFPYVSDMPLSPSTVNTSLSGSGSPIHPNYPPNGGAFPLPGAQLNQAQSTDMVPGYVDPPYAYAEVRNNPGVRVRNAVSTSSEQEKSSPLKRNESYGMLVASPSPMMTSPPPNVQVQEESTMN